MTQSAFVRPATRLAALLGTTAMTLGFAGAAFAQTEAAPPTETVVVTGTRANLANFQAPTPTAVIGIATLNAQAVTSVATALNQNPAFKGLRSPQGNAQNQGSPGQATADLRGLGGQRTLVLVNGDRMVPFAPGSNLSVPTAVDLNLIPTIMLDHVDVVTGGASAQWGSDAVGGVVNLIMRNNFNGLEVRGQYGTSQRSDFREPRIAAIVGTPFFGDKGHFVLAFDASQNSGVGDSSTRPWAATLGNIYANSGTKTLVGGPTNLNINDVRLYSSANGLITSGPLANNQFNGSGALTPFNIGTYNNGTTTQVGGDGVPINKGQGLIPAVKKAALWSHTSYQVTPDITAALDLSYAYSLGYLDSQATGLDGSTRLPNAGFATIDAVNNPFVPAAVKAVYTGAGPTNPSTFSFVKSDFGLGGLGAYVTNTQPRIVASLNGDLGKFIMGDNWKWDAHVLYGENLYHGNYKNTVISGNGLPTTNPNFVPNRVLFALDAVTVTPANVGTTGLAIGSVACRSVLTNAVGSKGCVPYNPFGAASTNAASAAWFHSDGINIVKYEQEDAAANIHGEPFSTWAGPVAVAAGVEYRQEQEHNTGDQFANVNAYGTGNDPTYRASFNVVEGFFETQAPLAKDQYYIHALNIDGSVRMASYSDVGMQTTWKVGVNLEPINGVRFRVTESQDIRAPQLWELAAPGNAQTNIISGLLNYASTSIPQNSTAGSSNVKPENANTTTIGVVLEPPREWANGLFSGFTASVDYYDIDIEGAITNTQGATAVALCNSGQSFFCNMFTSTNGVVQNASTGGTLVSFLSPTINFGGVENIGYDLVAQYRKNLADWGLPYPVRTTTAVSGTYIAHIFVNPGTGIAHSTIDRAGENGQANQSTGNTEPRVRINVNETLDLWGFSTTLQMLYVGKGTIDNTFITSNTPVIGRTTIDNNVVPEYVKFDLSGSYNITPHLQVFGVINNLMDVWPSRSPYNVLNTYSSGAYYDKVGRAYTIGFDYKY